MIYFLGKQTEDILRKSAKVRAKANLSFEDLVSVFGSFIEIRHEPEPSPVVFDETDGLSPLPLRIFGRIFGWKIEVSQ